MTVGPTHLIMSKEARIKKIDLINEALCQAVEALAEEAEYDRKKAYSLQKRVDALEKKLRFYELETGSINYYLAEGSRISAPD